jgi:hypothetical protein
VVVVSVWAAGKNSLCPPVSVQKNLVNKCVSLSFDEKQMSFQSL